MVSHDAEAIDPPSWSQHGEYQGIAGDGLPLFYAPSRHVWRMWLEEHHRKDRGVWLVYYKKGSDRPRVAYNDAVEGALCFGTHQL